MILPKYPRTGMARGKVTFANLAKLGVRVVRIGDHVVIAVADTIAGFGSYGGPGAGFCDGSVVCRVWPRCQHSCCILVKGKGFVSAEEMLMASAVELDAPVRLVACCVGG